MKVLVPGKAVAKTAIGDCTKCEAILQENVKDLLPCNSAIVVAGSLGSTTCPNCGNRVKMYALGSDHGRMLLARVAAYENTEIVRAGAGFKP